MGKVQSSSSPAKKVNNQGDCDQVREACSKTPALDAATDSNSLSKPGITSGAIVLANQAKVGTSHVVPDQITDQNFELCENRLENKRAFEALTAKRKKIAERKEKKTHQLIKNLKRNYSNVNSKAVVDAAEEVPQLPKSESREDTEAKSSFKSYKTASVNTEKIVKRIEGRTKPIGETRIPFRTSPAEVKIISNGQSAALKKESRIIKLAKSPSYNKSTKIGNSSTSKTTRKTSPKKKKKKAQGIRISRADLDVITGLGQIQLNETSRILEFQVHSESDCSTIPSSNEDISQRPKPKPLLRASIANRRVSSEAKQRVLNESTSSSDSESKVAISDCKPTPVSKKLATARSKGKVRIQKKKRKIKIMKKRVYMQKKMSKTLPSMEDLIETNSKPVEIVDITLSQTQEETVLAQRLNMTHSNIRMPVLRLQKINIGSSKTMKVPKPSTSTTIPTAKSEPEKKVVLILNAEHKPPAVRKTYRPSSVKKERQTPNEVKTYSKQSFASTSKQITEKVDQVVVITQKEDGDYSISPLPARQFNNLWDDWDCEQAAVGNTETEKHGNEQKSMQTFQNMLNITEEEKLEIKITGPVVCVDATKRPCGCSIPVSESLLAKVAKGNIPVAMVSPMFKEPLNPSVENTVEIILVNPVLGDGSFNKGREPEPNSEPRSKPDPIPNPHHDEALSELSNPSLLNTFENQTTDSEPSKVGKENKEQETQSSPSKTKSSPAVPFPPAEEILESASLIENPVASTQNGSKNEASFTLSEEAPVPAANLESEVQAEIPTSSSEVKKQVVSPTAASKEPEMNQATSSPVEMSNPAPLTAQECLADLEDWDLEASKNRKLCKPFDVEQDVIDDVTILSFRSEKDLLTFPPEAAQSQIKDLVLRKTNDIKQVKGWRKKMSQFNIIPVGSNEEIISVVSEGETVVAPQPATVPVPVPQKARRLKKLALVAREMNAEYVNYALQALRLPELQVRVHRFQFNAPTVNLNSFLLPACCTPVRVPKTCRRKPKVGRLPKIPKQTCPESPDSHIDVCNVSRASSVSISPSPIVKRKMPNSTKPSKRVRLELGRLGVQYVEMDNEIIDVVGTGEEEEKAHEETKDTNPDACEQEFCKLGCLCDSLKADSHTVEHCGRADCMFECSCPPDRITRISTNATHKTLLTEAYLNQIEDEGKKNLSKTEKDFLQTVVKKGSEVVVMGEKKQRERRIPNRFKDSVFLMGSEFVSSGFERSPSPVNLSKYNSKEYSMRSLKDMVNKNYTSKQQGPTRGLKRTSSGNPNEAANQTVISQKIHKVMQEKKLLFKDLVAQEEVRHDTEVDLTIRNQEMIQVVRWVRLQQLLADNLVSIRVLKRRNQSSIIISKPQDAVATDITIDVRDLKDKEEAPGLVHILFSTATQPTSYAILFCDGVKWELAANLEGQSNKKPLSKPPPAAIAPNPASKPTSKTKLPSDLSENRPKLRTRPVLPHPNRQIETTAKPNKGPTPPKAPAPPKAPEPKREVEVRSQTLPKPTEPQPSGKIHATAFVPSVPANPPPSRRFEDAKRQLELALERESLYFPKPLYAALQIGTLPGTQTKHCRMKLILPMTDASFVKQGPKSESQVTCLLPMMSQEDRWCIVALKGMMDAGLLMPGTNCPIPRSLMYQAAQVAHDKRVRVTLPIKLLDNEPAAPFMLETFGIYAFPGINEHVFLGPFSTSFLSSMSELPPAVRLVPCISNNKTREKESSAVASSVLESLWTRVSQAIDGKHACEEQGKADMSNEKITRLKAKEMKLAKRLAELEQIAHGSKRKSAKVIRSSSGDGSTGAVKIGRPTGVVKKAKKTNAESFSVIWLKEGLKVPVQVEVNPNGTVMTRHPLNAEMRLGFTNLESAQEWFIKYENDKERLYKKWRLGRPIATPFIPPAPTAPLESGKDEVPDAVKALQTDETVDLDDNSDTLIDDSEDSHDSQDVRENIDNLASVLAEDYVDVESISDGDEEASSPEQPGTSSAQTRTKRRDGSGRCHVEKSASERIRRRTLADLQKNLTRVLHGSGEEIGKASKIYVMSKAKQTLEALNAKSAQLSSEEAILKLERKKHLRRIQQLCKNLGPEAKAVSDIVMSTCSSFETRRVDMLMAVESSYNRIRSIRKPSVSSSSRKHRVYFPAKGDVCKSAVPEKHNKEGTSIHDGPSSGFTRMFSSPKDSQLGIASKDVPAAAPATSKTAPAIPRKFTTFTIPSRDESLKSVLMRRVPSPPQQTEEPEFRPMISSVQSLAGSDFHFDFDEPEEGAESEPGIELETANISGESSKIEELSKTYPGVRVNSKSSQATVLMNRFVRVSDFAKLKSLQKILPATTPKNTGAQVRAEPSHLLLRPDNSAVTTPVHSHPIVTYEAHSSALATAKKDDMVKARSSTVPLPIHRIPILQRTVKGTGGTTSTLTQRVSLVSGPAKNKTGGIIVTSLKDVKSATGAANRSTSKPGPGVVEFIKVPSKTFFSSQASRVTLASNVSPTLQFTVVNSISTISTPSVSSNAVTSIADAGNNVATSSTVRPPPPLLSVVPFQPSSTPKLLPISSSAVKKGTVMYSIPSTTLVTTKSGMTSTMPVYFMPTSSNGKPVQMTPLNSTPELRERLLASKRQIMVFKSTKGKLVAATSVPRNSTENPSNENP